jgi:hypothetical protein
LTSLGLTLEIVYADTDFVEVAATCANASFRGTISLYTGAAELRKAARTIDGFPKGRGDSREVFLGAPGNDWAGGSARLTFNCDDSAGHAFVKVVLDSGNAGGALRQGATLGFPVVAAAVDRFVAQLAVLEAHALSGTCEGTATLDGAT